MNFFLMVAEITEGVKDLGQTQMGEPTRDRLGRQALTPQFHDGPDGSAACLR